MATAAYNAIEPRASMRVGFIFSTFGILLLLFSASLAPPILIALFRGEAPLATLFDIFAASTSAGLLIWLPKRTRQYSIRSRDGFVVVSMFWVVLGLFSSLPLIFCINLSVPDAVFESVSAFTTTGATVISGLDTLPMSILFYRSELQWLGGIGMVVSAVALLPMMGVGGMQLYRAETPGPMKDEKLTPRITHTARTLWKIYAAITLGCAVAYWLAGMSVFDAIAHSMSTVSTGGFSTHDASLAYYDSPLIEAVSIVFMLAGAINFSIHYLAWGNLRPSAYWQNTEVRAFLLIVLTLIVITTAGLYLTDSRDSVLTALRYAAFTVVSVITSTGLGTDDFSLWPSLLPVLLIFSSFMGGCAGSTAGGMKIIRFVLMWKQAGLEILRLIHPRMERPLKIGGRLVSQRVIASVWAFFSVYVAVFAIFMLILMVTGMDQITAFGAVATCINNLGPGLGEVSTSFAHVDPSAKWLLSVAMILGRLEIFTILVLFSPTFWRE